jgi:hypothetical protein
MPSPSRLPKQTSTDPRANTAIVVRPTTPLSQLKPYPSDLSDAGWALIELALTAWRQARLKVVP